MAGFIDFLRSAEVGRNANDYISFGSDTPNSLNEDNIEDILYHINVLSEAGLNKIKDSNVESAYVKRKLLNAKLELREAYLKIMDSNR